MCKFEIDGDIVKIYLTKGKIALADLIDYDMIKNFNWYSLQAGGA